MPDPNCTDCDGSGVWPCDLTGTDDFCDDNRMPDGTCKLLCGPCLVCQDFDKPVVIPGQLTLPDCVSEHAERG